MQTQKAFDNFFFVGLGFEFRVCACKAGALPLEAHFRFIVLWLFWRWGLANDLPELA
jgi:hypothetical protein